MTKDQCVTVVDMYRSSWNQEPADKATYAAWWRYLEPFDEDVALQALDWFIAKGGRFPPRISDVYRRVFDLTYGEAPLGANEALGQAQEVVEANNRGVQPPIMDPLVKEALHSMHARWIPWSSKSFLEEYELVVAERYFARNSD